MSQSSDEPEVGPGEAAYRLARAELAGRQAMTEPHDLPSNEETTDA